MPQSNPGFDIRATRQGVELRVEVKAHTGSASIVDVTKREIEECSRQEAREGIRWELWNVENLSAAVPSPIRITRYDHIPDDALSERILALDLRKCTPVHP